MTTPRELLKVTDFKGLAWYLYRKLYGNRCVACAKPVDQADADLYRVEGLDEVILKHLECE